MWFFKLVLLVIMGIALYVAFAPVDWPTDEDDHLGMSYGTDHVAPSLLIAVFCVLGLMAMS